MKTETFLQFKIAMLGFILTILSYHDFDLELLVHTIQEALYNYEVELYMEQTDLCKNYY